MSQVYRSEEDHVEGRDLDPKIGKSCILESQVWTRIGRVLKSQNLYLFFLNHPVFEKELVMWSIVFPCVCLFQIVINVSYNITQLQIVFHSHSIIIEMSLVRKLDLLNTIIKKVRKARLSH